MGFWNGRIADCTWESCEECVNWKEGNGCDVPVAELSFSLDSINESIFCDQYEEKYEG